MFEPRRFPDEHVERSRLDADAQSRHARVVAAKRRENPDVACPRCGATADELAWIFFRSPPETWRALAGREGVIVPCPRDGAQAAFHVTLMS